MHTRKIWTKLALVGLLLAGGGVSACNTIEGAGEDIQSGGRTIERTSENVRK